MKSIEQERKEEWLVYTAAKKAKKVISTAQIAREPSQRQPECLSQSERKTQAFVEKFDMVAAHMYDIAQKVRYTVTQRMK